SAGSTVDPWPSSPSKMPIGKPPVQQHHMDCPPAAPSGSRAFIAGVLVAFRGLFLLPFVVYGYAPWLDAIFTWFDLLLLQPSAD
ncbi:MAG: hypothetical protein ACK4P4_23845, partial [Allorhizobium sp.]